MAGRGPVLCDYSVLHPLSPESRLGDLSSVLVPSWILDFHFAVLSSILALSEHLGLFADSDSSDFLVVELLDLVSLLRISAVGSFDM